MYGLSDLVHSPDSACQCSENAVQTGELEEKTNRREERNGIMSDLETKKSVAETDALQNPEKIGNGSGNLPESHDLADKEGSIGRSPDMSKDSINLFYVSSNGTKFPNYKTEFYPDRIVTECELPLITEGNNDTREETVDGIRLSQEVNDWVYKESSLDGKQKKNGDSLNPFVVLANDVNFENEMELYTDKRVTECQLPELMVFFKDGAYQVVKDICIDDGLPSFDKISVENLELHDKGLFSFKQSDFDTNDHLSKEKVATSAIVSNQTNPFLESDCKVDVANKCTSENFPGNGEEYFEEFGNVISNLMNPFIQYDCKIDGSDKCSETLTGNGDGEYNDIGHVITNEKAIPESLLLVQHFEEDGSHSHPEPFDFDGTDQQLPNQDTSKEDEFANSVIATAAESKCNEAYEASLDSKLESGSITFDFTSSPPATSSGEKDSQNEDCQLPAQTLNTSNTDEGTVDSRTASDRSVFIQHGNGETSFSALDPLSGPIAYSGPIPYSGNISLRSDSSTTSARSFAFPIMQSECNSSPVKMAKADRRSYRKHRGWGFSLLCCRF